MNQSHQSTYLSRKLRKNFTFAERTLWYLLRNRQVRGVKFRRQFPVGKYIVDFISIENKLVVEIDGGQHNDEDHQKKDNHRSVYLMQQGFTILRFWNNEVTKNKEEVLKKIKDALPSS